MNLRTIILLAALGVGTRCSEGSRIEVANASPQQRMVTAKPLHDIALSNGMVIPRAKIEHEYESLETGTAVYDVLGYYPRDTIAIFDYHDGRPYALKVHRVRYRIYGKEASMVQGYEAVYDLTRICDGVRIPLWEVAETCPPLRYPAVPDRDVSIFSGGGCDDPSLVPSFREKTGIRKTGNGISL